MVDPSGTLTAAQHEIMEIVWQASAAGVTVAEIWQAIGDQRAVARTTVLNQVDRLEKRGWLSRKKSDDGFRYVATRSREQASQGLAEEFVNSFFGGSASELVMSLLGSKKLTPKDVEKLRNVLNSATAKRNTK